MLPTLVSALSFCVGQAADLPVVRITADDTRIDRSCRVVVPSGVIIPDANGDGVIHIAADDITIEFADGSELRGAAPGTPWDTLTGIGVRVRGHKGVTIRGARVHGYKVGVSATDADGLTIDRADLSDNYRQRLRSTPQAEDGADWLFPHNNDNNEWVTQHGAALSIKKSDRVTVRNVRVRRSQNGIILDRVNRSTIYDNDCSFLSGWGLGLWRSSDNTISRNAFDFCVRGHAEGVYNRGQDSAGILMFEQCNRNVIAENSVTHGGDGVFGFGGREALGETAPADGRLDYAHAGCNNNVFAGNDLSYAPAHGLEMTFSEGNVITGNHIVGNAICGIWGGYSSSTVIVRNHFEANGGMAYGLERGAVNIEHGSDNLIADNTFINNKVGVHLWWDNDGRLLDLPGVKAGYRGVTGNVVARNEFVIDEHHPFTTERDRDPRLLVLQIRNTGDGPVHDNAYMNNTVRISAPNAAEIDATPGAEPIAKDLPLLYRLPEVQAIGESRPVGARAHLRGRDKIIMDEWGPWDHESPMVRLVGSGPEGHVYEVFGVTSLRASVSGDDVRVSIETPEGGPARVTVAAPPGVTAYSVRLAADGFERTLTGTIIATEWTARFFPWTTDPRENLEGWRAQAHADKAIEAIVPALSFNYGGGGPRDQASLAEVKNAAPGPDRFGMIATTSVRLTPGRWRVRTLSDDGVRVLVDGKPVIENWTWHAPTKDTGAFTVEGPEPVEILVEHFEIDGAAALVLALEPAE